MANFEKAITYVLANEGGHYEDPATNEISNYGVSLAWLKTIDPTATADTIRSLTKDAAIELYRQHWWLRYKMDMIPSDRCATKLFDACVNIGPQTAIKIFQKTLNEPLDESEIGISEDGYIGNQVANAVTRDMGYPTGEDQLLSAFAANLATHYEEIAVKNPVHQKDLPGWLKRAEKLPV